MITPLAGIKKYLKKTLVPSVKSAHQFVLSTIPSVKGGQCESRGPFYTQAKVSQTRVCKTLELGLGFGAQTLTQRDLSSALLLLQRLAV
jgi:hypothetical protein